MQSVQESKQELEAAVRYAENAISSAKATIETLEFRQEMAKKTYQEQTGREFALAEREEALENLLEDHRASAFEDAKTIGQLKSQVALLEERIRNDVPTMPVIPKAVAIAIFREGMAYGACRVCDELDNATDISIEENEYCGDFEVSFSKYIDLSDHLDLDYLRESTSVYDESSVIDALYTLCADNEFECRIHGVDDQEEKKND